MLQGKKRTVFSVAKQFKQKLGCKILLDVIHTSKEVSDASKLWGPDGWKAASKAMADSVKGETFVVLGEVFNPDGVWVQVERPALQANSKVPHDGIHAYQFVGVNDFRQDQALLTSNGQNLPPTASTSQGRVTTPQKNGSSSRSSGRKSTKSVPPATSG